MREIKLKAFVPSLNKIVVVVMISFTHRIIHYKTDDGNMAVQDKDLTLIQYTGLKDKNDCEIYEGDIVKYQVIRYTDCSRKEIERIDEPMIGEIYYVDGITLGIKFVGGIDHIFWPTSVLDSSQNFEVIGNIYENPELLNN